jgi:hypothetical protein
MKLIVQLDLDLGMHEKMPDPDFLDNSANIDNAGAPSDDGQNILSQREAIEFWRTPQT